MTIGDRAFDGCTGLTSVTIPAGVTTIGRMAFANCSGLTSVTMPANVRLGYGSFDKGLDDVYKDGGSRAGVYRYTRGAWRREERGGARTVTKPAD